MTSDEAHAKDAEKAKDAQKNEPSRPLTSSRSSPTRRSSFVTRRSSLVVLLILLLAFALRAWNLTGTPPGLTHDEANHGREAIGILAGELRLFFPLNYGSEPLYSYTAALSMALLGRGLFALRLVNVLFGLLAIAIMVVMAMRGRYTATDHVGLWAGATYWHFLGGLWIYLLLFLLFVH